MEEYAAGKGPLPPRRRRKKHSVYIATIEQGLALLDSLIDTDRAHEIVLLVVNELHIIGELGRGATLKTLLTKIKFINVLAGIPIIGMSATIDNLYEIAEFLNADTNTHDFRPIELKQYIKCGSDILEINSMKNTLDDAFTYYRSINFDYTDEVTKIDPDHIAGLVSEIIPDESCLIFCPLKRNCENLAILLS